MAKKKLKYYNHHGQPIRPAVIRGSATVVVLNQAGSSSVKSSTRFALGFKKGEYGFDLETAHWLMDKGYDPERTAVYDTTGLTGGVSEAITTRLSAIVKQAKDYMQSVMFDPLPYSDPADDQLRSYAWRIADYSLVRPADHVIRINSVF